MLFFFQAEDGIRDYKVTGVQTCALPISRTKKLSPDEIQRGTFTITNPGVFGSYAGAPIINQPQVAILRVGAIEERPKGVTVPDGADGLAVRTLGLVSVSYDNRTVGLAGADSFL